MTAMEIVRAVAERHGLQVDELRGPSRSRKIARARREAALALRSEKYSARAIAIKLNRSLSNIKDHLYPQRRARSIAKRVERLRERERLPGDVRTVVISNSLWAPLAAYAQAEGIEVRTAIHQFVRDGLEGA